jgi:thiamine biosynthesis lipoprotein
MGVEFEVILYAASEREAKDAQRIAFDRIAELNRIFSDYDTSSEALRWCASAPHRTAVPLSPDLARMLRLCRELHQKTDGAFDITLGPLTKLWRRARRQGELPTAETVQTALANKGMELIEVDSKTDVGRLLKADLRLDFGGIVKGYAADEALQAIRKQGFSKTLVRGSGDIAVGDPPPGAEGWRVGIAPLDAEAEPTEFVTLANACISTSGDARQHLVVDGKRYSHILDPRTGWPVVGRSSVTVIAPRGYLADSLATASSTLSIEKGIALLEQFNSEKAAVKGLITIETEGKTRQLKSRNWE